VGKAHLAVVPDDLSRAAGQANPALTYHLAGFVNGEDATAAGVAGAPDLATTADASSPAGTYPITVVDAGTLAAANYDFPSTLFGAGTLTVTQGATASVAVASSLPGSTYGQSVSFTATVTGNGPVPGGTVQFVVDGTDLGSPIALTGGVATSISTASLGAGSHTVLAQYSGDADYAAVTGSYTQAVAKASLTLVADDAAMNHYDAVPTLTYHYTGFANGEDANSAGIAASIGLSTAATSTSPAGYYPIVPSADSFTAANYVVGSTANGTLTVKPKVMDVKVDFGNESISLLGLQRDLPFVNIKAIDVIFSDDVAVSSSMLQLTGVNVPSYAFSGFSYDPTAYKATWSLPTALGVDQLMLSLSGETASPASGSGPNIAADSFADSFSVLPGDVNGDGVLNGNDLTALVDQIKAGQYSIWDDVDGNGADNLTDYSIVRMLILASRAR
jgi:hypothetical protein